MKTLFLLIALLPLTAVASDKTNTQNDPAYKNDKALIDSTREAQKNQLLEEKQKDAAENFRNFQENNHSDKTF